MIPHGRNEPIRYKYLNAADETIPAYAVIMPADGEDEFPSMDGTNTDSPVCYINESSEVLSGNYGRFQAGPVVICLYDSEGDTPAVGDMLGPVDSTWAASVDGPPRIVCIGIYNEDVHLMFGQLVSTFNRRFKAVTTAAVAATDATFTVNTLYATDNGPEWDDDDATEYEVVNTDSGIAVPEGTTVLVETDSSEDAPEGRPAALHVYFALGEEQQVVTDFQVTGTTLQIKTRTVKAMFTDDESEWTTVHTGSQCP